MAEVQIGNAFVSAKPDSVDSSIVSSSEWNADFLFRNGTDGQIPVRDTAEITGARWTQGPSTSFAQGSSSGGTTTGALASLVLTFTSNAVVVFFIYSVVTTSAGQAMSLSLRRDGVSIAGPNTAGDGISGTAVFVTNESPGTHTYDVIGTVGSGTITSASIVLNALILGT